MAPEDGAWLSYRSWNDALAEHFFGDTSSGRPVYLDVEDEVIESIGRRTGAGTGTPEFCAAVSATLNWDSGRLFAPHRAAYVDWEEAGRQGPPPTIALLCFFTVAAERMHADGQLASHNYYGRLSELAGLEGGDDRANAKLRRDYGAQALELWAGLNRWLREANGRYGLPTAYSFDRRVNVGVPISQALVRAADRERLRDMFGAFGLRPRQRLGRDDMTELLESWAPQAPATLRRLLIGTDALREHVADIALVELEAWDGRGRRPGRGGPETPHGQSIVLAASYRQGMWRRLALDLAALGEIDGIWSVPTEATGPAADAARAAGGVFEAFPRDGWTVFRGGAEISMPDVLKGEFVLGANGDQLRRSPRRVIILRADDVLPWLVEQPRIELWEDTWLLVHGAVVPDVDGWLERVARPGFERVDADALPGLPEGWWFYEGVQVATAPPDVPGGREDLLPLVPLSDSQVAISGGYPLVGHSTFHVSAAPEARVTASGEGEAHLRLVTEFTYGDVDVTGPVAEVGNAQVIDLKELNLGEGDYRLVLDDPEGRTLATATFRIRGAEHPLAPAPWVTEWIGHAADSNGIEWFGTHAADPPEGVWLRGAEMRGTTEPLVDGSGSEGDPVPSELGARASAHDDESGPVQATRALTDAAMPCPPHRMRLHGVDSEGRLPRRYKGYCSTCGLEKWYRRDGGYRRRRRDPADGSVSRVRTDLPPLPPVPEDSLGDVDTLLDAVSTEGAGSWAAFERLVRWIDDAPWAAAEYARTLSSLGHIEVLFDGPGRPARWAVMPPALVRVASSDTAAFLTGLRRPSSVELLRENAAILGGEVTVEPQRDAPALVRVDAATSDDLALVATETGIAILPEASNHLLQGCPTLKEIATAIPITAPPGSTRTSRYEPGSGKWMPVAGVSGDGSYSFATRPMRYLVTCEERWFEVDSQLAKYAAAALSGVASLAYDPDSRVLHVPLGARLPGLFERAVVLCSGHAPTPAGDGRIGYTDVPVHTARMLWSKLSPEAWLGSSL